MRLALGAAVFTVLVPGAVAVWLPLLLVSNVELSTSAFAWALAMPLFVFGACVYFWCTYDFVTSGRGTPSPSHAPRHLVVRGLYRVVRNPMYVGILAVLLAWNVVAPMDKIVAYTVAVAIAFHGRVCLYEEPALRELFGVEYRAYCARVNRWWPRWIGAR